MKRLLLLALLVAFSISLRAGDSIPANPSDADTHPRAHNIYASVFESINLVSVNYDSRFPGSRIFGWHAGAGYPYCDFGGFSLPLGVNALFGKCASKFELGIGVTPYVYAWKHYRYLWDYDHHCSPKEYYGPKHWSGGVAFSLNVGYRLQRKSGFFFRTGFSPVVCTRTPFDTDGNGLGRAFMLLMPYLSFGYTLK